MRHAKYKNAVEQGCFSFLVERHLCISCTLEICSLAAPLKGLQHFPLFLRVSTSFTPTLSMNAPLSITNTLAAHVELA